MEPVGAVLLGVAANVATGIVAVLIRRWLAGRDVSRERSRERYEWLADHQEAWTEYLLAANYRLTFASMVLILYALVRILIATSSPPINDVVNLLIYVLGIVIGAMALVEFGTTGWTMFNVRRARHRDTT